MIDYKKAIYVDAYRGHILEGPFQGIGIFIPFIFMKIDMVSFILSLLFVNIRGMIRHDHRCTKIAGNHHLMHHFHPNSNYGEYWLDILFGTAEY
jgi:sterol desaturase/sphingolipid hydroxylase (fatty acid hydroxylase superfamily)